MKITFRNISYIFSAGAIGGLINSLAVWIFRVIGLTGALGIAIVQDPFSSLHIPPC